jgi:hypothetical protein
MAHQQPQRGAWARTRRGLKSKATAERAERRKMTSFRRWTAAADKGDLRRRTRPVVTDGAWSPSAVSRGHTGGQPVRPIRRCLQLTSGAQLKFEFSMIFTHPNFDI